MKHSFAILTAAFSALTGMVQQVLDMEFIVIDDPASSIPRMTPKLVEQYAYAGASDQEIADRFLKDPAEIRQQFRQVLKVARAMRNINLRSLQYDVAKKFNSPMLIWLGKNELGQSTNPAKPGEPEPEFELDAL